MCLSSSSVLCARSCHCIWIVPSVFVQCFVCQALGLVIVSGVVTSVFVQCFVCPALSSVSGLSLSVPSVPVFCVPGVVIVSGLSLRSSSSVLCARRCHCIWIVTSVFVQCFVCPAIVIVLCARSIWIVLRSSSSVLCARRCHCIFCVPGVVTVSGLSLRSSSSVLCARRCHTKHWTKTEGANPDTMSPRSSSSVLCARSCHCIWIVPPVFVHWTFCTMMPGVVIVSGLSLRSSSSVLCARRCHCIWIVPSVFVQCFVCTQNTGRRPRGQSRYNVCAGHTKHWTKTEGLRPVFCVPGVVIVSGLSTSVFVQCFVCRGVVIVSGLSRGSSSSVLCATKHCIWTLTEGVPQSGLSTSVLCAKTSPVLCARRCHCIWIVNAGLRPGFVCNPVLTTPFGTGVVIVSGYNDNAGHTKHWTKTEGTSSSVLCARRCHTKHWTKTEGTMSDTMTTPGFVQCFVCPALSTSVFVKTLFCEARRLSLYLDCPRVFVQCFVCPALSLYLDCPAGSSFSVWTKPGVFIVSGLSLRSSSSVLCARRCHCIWTTRSQCFVCTAFGPRGQSRYNVCQALSLYLDCPKTSSTGRRPKGQSRYNVRLAHKTLFCVPGVVNVSGLSPRSSSTVLCAEALSLYLDCPFGLRPVFCVPGVVNVSGLSPRSSSSVLCARRCHCIWIVPSVFVQCFVCHVVTVSGDRRDNPDTMTPKGLRPVFCVPGVDCIWIVPSVFVQCFVCTQNTGRCPIVQSGYNDNAGHTKHWTSSVLCARRCHCIWIVPSVFVQCFVCQALSLYLDCPFGLRPVFCVPGVVIVSGLSLRSSSSVLCARSCHCIWIVPSVFVQCFVCARYNDNVVIVSGLSLRSSLQCFVCHKTLDVVRRYNLDCPRSSSSVLCATLSLYLDCQCFVCPALSLYLDCPLGLRSVFCVPGVVIVSGLSPRSSFSVLCARRCHCIWIVPSVFVQCFVCHGVVIVSGLSPRSSVFCVPGVVIVSGCPSVFVQCLCARRCHCIWIVPGRSPVFCVPGVVIVSGLSTSVFVQCFVCPALSLYLDCPFGLRPVFCVPRRCHCIWIVPSVFVQCFVCPALSLYLDCPFGLRPVFCVPGVVIVSGLSLRTSSSVLCARRCHCIWIVLRSSSSVLCAALSYLDCQSSVLCARRCHCIWIVPSVFVQCFVCPALSLYLDCPFGLRPVFCVPGVVIVSGLSLRSSSSVLCATLSLYQLSLRSSSSVLCARRCHCIWIVPSVFVQCFVCPALSLYLDCPFGLRPVFCVPGVVIVSGLSFGLRPVFCVPGVVTKSGLSLRSSSSVLCARRCHCIWIVPSVFVQCFVCPALSLYPKVFVQCFVCPALSLYLDCPFGLRPLFCVPGVVIVSGLSLRYSSIVLCARRCHCIWIVPSVFVQFCVPGVVIVSGLSLRSSSSVLCARRCHCIWIVPSVFVQCFVCPALSLYLDCPFGLRPLFCVPGVVIVSGLFLRSSSSVLCARRCSGLFLRSSSSVLCARRCHCIWIVPSVFVQCFVCPALSLYLDCSFGLRPVFCVPGVVIVSGLSFGLRPVFCVPGVVIVSGLSLRSSSSVLCARRCHCIWIVPSVFVQCFVCPALSLYLDCPFGLRPVFCVPGVVIVSGLSLRSSSSVLCARRCHCICVPGVVIVSGLSPRSSSSVLCARRCHCIWIVPSVFVRCFVCQALSLYLDCPLGLRPVFCVPGVVIVSGLSPRSSSSVLCARRCHCIWIVPSVFVQCFVCQALSLYLDCPFGLRPVFCVPGVVIVSGLFLRSSSSVLCARRCHCIWIDPSVFSSVYSMYCLADK